MYFQALSSLKTAFLSLRRCRLSTSGRRSVLLVTRTWFCGAILWLREARRLKRQTVSPATLPLIDCVTDQLCFLGSSRGTYAQATSAGKASSLKRCSASSWATRYLRAIEQYDHNAFVWCATQIELLELALPYVKYKQSEERYDQAKLARDRAGVDYCHMEKQNKLMKLLQPCAILSNTFWNLRLSVGSWTGTHCFRRAL